MPELDLSTPYIAMAHLECVACSARSCHAHTNYLVLISILLIDVSYRALMVYLVPDTPRELKEWLRVIQELEVLDLKIDP